MVEDKNAATTEEAKDAKKSEAVPVVKEPASSLEAAGITPVGDTSTFTPVAFLTDGPQEENESRVDYLTRLSRGSGMNRAIG